jgi:hypothetical protein
MLKKDMPRKRTSFQEAVSQPVVTPLCSTIKIVPFSSLWQGPRHPPPFDIVADILRQLNQTPPVPPEHIFLKNFWNSPFDGAWIGAGAVTFCKSATTDQWQVFTKEKAPVEETVEKIKKNKKKEFSLFSYDPFVYAPTCKKKHKHSQTYRWYHHQR